MQETQQMQMALTIRAVGDVVTSNFPEFNEWVRSGLSTVNMNLSTDDEFVEADGVVKNLSMIEDGIKAARDAMLRDAKKLYDALTDMDTLCADTAKVRLALSKQIAKRKDEVRAELLSTAMESLICAPGQRHWFSRSLSEAMKGKKTLESITRSLEVTAAIHNGMIRKSRAKIEAFTAQHGIALVMDRDELEIKTPEVVESELRRRVEAQQAEVERRRLQAEADAARADNARIAAEKAREDRARIQAEAKPDSPPATPAPEMTTDNRSDGTRLKVVNFPTRQPQPEAAEPQMTKNAEWQEFWKVVLAAFAPIKEARANLKHEGNIRAAEVFAKWVNEAAKVAREESMK